MKTERAENNELNVGGVWERRWARVGDGPGASELEPGVGGCRSWSQGQGCGASKLELERPVACVGHGLSELGATVGGAPELELVSGRGLLSWSRTVAAQPGLVLISRSRIQLLPTNCTPELISLRCSWCVPGARGFRFGPT
jgi:hypothetical protein